MARTFKTLSLSLPPEAVEELRVLGAASGRSACRVAAEAVLSHLRTVAAAREAVPDDVVPMILRGVQDSLSGALAWLESERKRGGRGKRRAQRKKPP